MRLPHLLLATLALCAAPVARAETVHLVVLHTTDLHGALTAWDYGADRTAPRGLTRVATLVRQVRAEGAPVLLLDAGDATQGGIEAVRHDAHAAATPDPMMRAMTQLGYDAMAVGNHEFDFGAPAIAAARADAAFPWLAANVTRADGAPAFDGTIVRTLGGVRVGVIGLTTPAVPRMEDASRVAGFAFQSPVEAAAREVKRLREVEHCDVVVVLAHTGLERERADQPLRVWDTPDENWGYRLATEVPGVDVLVLGHTHVVVPSLLPAGAAGPVVTQAGRNGEALGRVDLQLTRTAPGARWMLEQRTARVLTVTDSVADDPALAAFAAPLHAAAEAALDRPVGQAATRIDSPHGRNADGAVWELIQRAQLDASGADVSLAALPDPALRLAPGALTVRDLVRLAPYENTLVTLKLTGDQLKDVLEQSARAWLDYTWEDGRPLTQPGYPGYNLDAAEGVSYEVDLTRPAGQRIVNLAWQGQPLGPDQALTVVTTSYRANGGGGFEALVHAPRVPGPEVTVREALERWLAKSGPLTNTFTSNWSVLPDYAPTPERPLIDRMARQGAAPKSELMRLFPDEPARRGDLAYWLARAFDWREKRLSGAFADVPDSLEPWLDGLLKRGVLGAQASAQYIEPFAPASLTTALDWCVAAARYEDFPVGDADAFRAALLTGTSIEPDAPRAPRGNLAGTSGAAQLASTRPLLAALGSPTLPLTRAQLLAVVSNLRYPTIRVLETTDFHGFVMGSKDRRSGRAIGGSAVLAAWIAKLRAENPQGTVLLDGGDCFQGTMISNLQYGRPIVEQMNALRYAATAIGNHEFDWTVDTLAQRAHEMHFAALGANMVERRTERLPGWARADTVVTRRGVRIGVFGLCYRETPTVTLPANVTMLRFQDDSATAARLVPVLRKRDRAQLVVEVGHVPAETDSTHRALSGDLPRLARSVRGVDAWLGGHSHNLVLDEINGVPVMIAGAHGECVGVCDLVVDPKRGRVVEHHARLQTTWADEVTPDSAMAERVKRWDAGIAPLAAQTIAQTPHAITRATGNGGDSGIGDLVADAMRDAVHADVALQNSGGLRADLPEGTITRGAVYEVMPFDNTIVTEELTGADLRELFSNGRLMPLSGLRVSVDPTRPEGQRLAGITLADGRPLDPAARYHVAMNNFMATGGDNLKILAGAPHTDTGLLVRDAIEAFIKARAKTGTFDYAPDGRIQRLETGKD